MDEYLAEADRLRLLRLGELEAELGSWSGKRGVGRLRSILRDWHPATDDEMSKFERQLVAAIVRAGAPRPQVNPLLDEKLVDCLWPEFNVMFELDGCSYHADPATQIRDARRDVRYTLLGYQVNRFTWPEFRDNPDDVIQRALALLRLRGWTG